LNVAPLGVGWRSTRQVSPGQISVGILQLCILITVPQLTLHTGIATLILLVLLHRSLAPILILRFFHGCFLLLSYGANVPRSRIAKMFNVCADVRN
jgi:hypothetical protein